MTINRPWIWYGLATASGIAGLAGIWHPYVGKPWVVPTAIILTWIGFGVASILEKLEEGK